MAKILLVEDDNNLREIYGARLMAEGFTIVAAADGEEALAMAVKEKPDLIISDVMMPKISGFDMLDILRTTAETKNTKVIMMTALSQPEDRERGEKLGADRYLVKSQVTLEDVVAVVHEVLEDGTPTATSTPTRTVVNPDAADSTKAGKPATEATKTTAPAAATTPAPNPVPATTTPPEPKPGTTATDTPAEPAVDTPTPEPRSGESADEPANEAPEPASKKKKVIEPINDLTKTGDNLDKLVQEEEAKENERTPGAAIPPSVDNQPDIAETIAQEKEEMEEQIQEFVKTASTDTPAGEIPPSDTPAEPALDAPAPVPTADVPAEDTVATVEPTAPEPVVTPAQPAPVPDPVPVTDTAPADEPTDATTPAATTDTTPPVADPNEPNPNDIAL